jgi:hypothetical protein
MKKQIRKGVFETNSSSTHSICIAKDVELDIPKTLQFKFGEFGWEEDTLSSTFEKASYLFTGLMGNNRNSDFDNIVETLKEKGIEVSYETAIDGCDGYVDHSYELTDFLNAICSSEKKLFDFLFSPLSFIITGNDNSDSDVEIKADYPHDEYYKGN